MSVLICEEHASVLPQWWCRQMRGRTLVCLDAHLDLQHVNPERLGRLEQSTSLEVFIGLEKPHHLLPDRHFSYSIEDFLYPGHRLGFIDRIVWVAPPHVNTGYSQAAFDQLQQMDAVLFDELASFKKVGGGWIEGRLLGLDIVICDYLQLEKVPLPVDCLMDIDIDYFVTVPGDVAWVNPREVVEHLGCLPIRPELVTVSRSVNSGFTPLCYRFLADYVAALWEGRHHDAVHYERLFYMERRLRVNENETVIAECQRELERYPRCAATYYLLSLGERDTEQANRYRRRAERLCTAYRPNLLRSACGYLNRQFGLNQSIVDALEQQLASAQDGSEEYVLAQVALGLIFCSCGQLDRALTCYQKSEQKLGPHPELAMEIGKRLLQSQPERAVPLLYAARHADKTRSAAHVFLSRYYRERGSLRQALEYLETAHTMAPAWGQLLPMLAACHERIGNRQQAQVLIGKYQDQQRKIEVLIRQLSEERHAEAWSATS